MSEAFGSVPFPGGDEEWAGDGRAGVGPVGVVGDRSRGGLDGLGGAKGSKPFSHRVESLKPRGRKVRTAGEVLP
jgi:hypothetical protein